MNTIIGFLSSPLKKQPERPPPSTMPGSASQSRTYSPRELRLSRRASDRFSESEGRSPRSRRSNVSSTSSIHDTIADISITSSRRETITTMAPPSKTPRRTSMGASHSSPATGRRTASQRVASSPRVRSSPRKLSVELGEDSIVSGYNSVSNTPVISNRAPSAKNTPVLSTVTRRSGAKNSPVLPTVTAQNSPVLPATARRSSAQSSPVLPATARRSSAKSSPMLSATRRSSARNSPATSTARKEATNGSNLTSVNSPLVAANDRPVMRPSPKTKTRGRRSQVADEEEQEEAQASEEQEVAAQEAEAADEENIDQEDPAQAADDDEQEHEFKRIMDYRWVDDKIELRVEWSDGERTWTDEEIFHEDSPEALFEFWRTFPDGRPANPKDPGVYQVFAVRKHRTLRGRKQVLVEWLGYDSSEQTWENQSYIEQVAKAHVDDYMSKLKGTRKGKTSTTTSKKGTAKTVAKGRGAPKAGTKSSTKTTDEPLSKTRGRSRVTKR